MDNKADLAALEALIPTLSVDLEVLELEPERTTTKPKITPHLRINIKLKLNSSTIWASAIKK